ncbi:hypothetical protein AVEN_157397-1 [Araneus ventricosus]|uniref:Uncharacterized protein n=1 Tax=Araneus ventricosus TaxID=182803 RepID=A0A4Y2G0L9_ARAVE|nr:hypothetical protein AVEN_157397-1 [Araneus ventricosus]
MVTEDSDSCGFTQCSYNSTSGVIKFFPCTNSAGLNPVLSCVTVRKASKVAGRFFSQSSPDCKHSTFNNRFNVLWNISTGLDCGWCTELWVTLIPNLSKNSVVKWLVKEVPLSHWISRGNPILLKTSSKASITETELISATGIASGYFDDIQIAVKR